MNDRALRGLALFGALSAAFDLLHDAMDQWGQSEWAAVNKGRRGKHHVYSDGTQVDAHSPDGTGRCTMSATALGCAATTQHVTYYTAGQLAGAIAITHALGYRVPLRALLAGAALNAGTHWIIDRREPLFAAARRLGKGEYLEYGVVVRNVGESPDRIGPGTAAFELDRSAHRFIGLVASAVTSYLATR